MDGEGILERKHSMVRWIFCVDSGVERAIDHKIRSLAGGAGFRSSEACSVKSATGMPVGIYCCKRRDDLKIALS